MGGLPGNSQPWRPLVCSCDASCLQPDTFLDLAARVEAGIRHLEAPPVPTSARPRRAPRVPTPAHSKHGHLGKAQPCLPRTPEPGSLWDRAGGSWMVSRRQHPGRWSPGSPREEAADGRLRNPLLCAWRKTGKCSPVTSKLDTPFLQPGCPSPGSPPPKLPASTAPLLFKAENGHFPRELHTSLGRRHDASLRLSCLKCTNLPCQPPGTLRPSNRLELPPGFGNAKASNQGATSPPPHHGFPGGRFGAPPNSPLCTVFRSWGLGTWGDLCPAWGQEDGRDDVSNPLKPSAVWSSLEAMWSDFKFPPV